LAVNCFRAALFFDDRRLDARLYLGHVLFRAVRARRLGLRFPAACPPCSCFFPMLGNSPLGCLQGYPQDAEALLRSVLQAAPQQSLTLRSQTHFALAETLHIQVRCAWCFGGALHFFQAALTVVAAEPVERSHEGV
jgi:hypothetical protein